MRYSVLTYIFGDYDRVNEIAEKDPEAEYILVTDNKDLESKTWNIIFDESLEGLSPFDKCYEVRFHPFKYCNTDICIRIDASMRITKSFKNFIDLFESGRYEMCLMIHPTRNSIEKEYYTWVRERGYPKKQARRILKTLKKLGLKRNYKGLYQGGFVVQRNNKKTKDLNDLTFAFLKYFGDKNKIERLDQTIFSFVANQCFDDMKILPVSEYMISKSPYIDWRYHNTKRSVPPKTDMIEPYLFNERCETKF